MAAFVHEAADEGYESRLSLFTVPPVETGVEHVYYKQFRPEASVSGSTTLEFDIVNNSPDYIDINRMELELMVQIKDDKGQPIKSTDRVGLVNLPITSIFRQMDLSIQQQVVTTTVGNNFAYKAIMDTLLSDASSDSTSWMTLGGFFKDTRGQMDEYDPKRDSNLGLSERSECTKEGKKWMLKSRLMMDFAQQPKPLLNGVPINIKLNPALDRFRLMYTDPSQAVIDLPQTASAARKNGQSTTSAVPQFYTLDITSANLVVPMIKLNPSLLMRHNESLAKQMALYPFTRSDIRVFNIPAQGQVWIQDNVFQDMIPKRLVVGLVSAKAYAGDPQKNPYNFRHYNLNYLSFSVNGQIVTGTALQPVFDQDHYVNEYAALFKWLTDSSDRRRTPPNISYKEMKSGYSLFVIDLEKSKGEDFTNPIRKGQSELCLRFKEQLPENITVIAYGIFDSMLRIDQARNVIVG